MFPLSIKDIREWMIDNRGEIKRLERDEFTSLRSPTRWLYSEFKDLLECYSSSPDCDNALLDLIIELNTDSDGLITWAKKYEYLGAKKLLMFEILYMNWDDEIKEEHLKVQKGVYVDREPFNNLICFCSVFSILYWEHEIHLAATGSVDEKIVSKVRDVLNTAGIL